MRRAEEIWLRAAVIGDVVLRRGDGLARLSECLFQQITEVRDWRVGRQSN